MSYLPEKRVTMKDVARATGVSVMTVSYALRGSREVSAATREKVLRTAEDLGYRRDPMLTRLATYRTAKKRSDRGLALAWLNLHPDKSTWAFRGSHFLEAWEGARLRAEKIGYHLDSFSLAEAGCWERLSGILRSRGIEGVIIGQPPPGMVEAQLEFEHFATVAVGRAIRRPELPRVVLNHVELVRRVMARMVAMGYRRIGLVMERGECVKNTFRNFSGYFGACEQLGVPAADIVPPLTPGQLDADNLGQWIQAHRVEGILVHREDQMDRLLPELGLRVPEDIGFAHLSTHQPSERISGFFFDPALYGSWAVDLVHWLLDRGERGVPVTSPSVILTGGEWQAGRTLRDTGEIRSSVEDEDTGGQTQHRNRR